MKKNIKNINGYEIHIDGKVFSLKRNKFLKVSQNIKGYYKVDICNNGIKAKKLIHRLLAEAFIPNPFNKLQVNHINGIKTDNRIENLEWCTSSENQIHAYKLKLKIPTLKQIEAGGLNLKKWHKKQKHNV
jgi:hypothetical protein